jgi:hypothetical protein
MPHRRCFGRAKFQGKPPRRHPDDRRRTGGGRPGHRRDTRCCRPPKPPWAKSSTSAAFWNCPCSPATPWTWCTWPPARSTAPTCACARRRSTTRPRSSPPTAAATTATSSPLTACPTCTRTAPARAWHSLRPPLRCPSSRCRPPPSTPASAAPLGALVNVSTKGGTNEHAARQAWWWLRHSAFDCPTIYQNRPPGHKLPIYRINRYGWRAAARSFAQALQRQEPHFLVLHLGGQQIRRSQRRRLDDLHRAALSLAQRRFLGPAQARRQLSALRSCYHRRRSGRALQPPASAGQHFPRQPHSPRRQKDPGPLPATQPARHRRRAQQFLHVPARQGGLLDRPSAAFDHAFSEKNRMFIRFHRDFWEEDKNRSFGNDVAGIILNRINRGIALDDVHMLSPTWCSTSVTGSAQQEFPERRVSRGFDLTSLGFSQTSGLSWTPATPPSPRIAPARSPRSRLGIRRRRHRLDQPQRRGEFHLDQGAHNVRMVLVTGCFPRVPQPLPRPTSPPT